MNDSFRTVIFIIIGILTLLSFIADYKKTDLERNKFLITVKFLILIGVSLMLVSTFLSRV